ncbi:MAG: c-type cytochrome [Ilumatobacteraceae bacterium]
MNLPSGSTIWRVLPGAPVIAALAFGVVTLLSPSTGESAAPVIETGRQLFATQCASCHATGGEGIAGRGPSLLDEGEAATDFVLRTGRMPIAAPDIQAVRGPVRYTEGEIVSLVAYVGSIGDGPDIPVVDTGAADTTRGGALYRLNCAACHVASGAGAPIGAGRYAPNLLAATPTQIGEAIVVGPGSMPVFASFTEGDIDDVASYIVALADADTAGARNFGGTGPAAEGLAAWLLALVPLIALTRWIGAPKDRVRPATDAGEPAHDASRSEVDP